MNTPKQWKKLSEITNFTPVKLIKKEYQLWDKAQNKMLKSATPIKDFKPRWMFECTDFNLTLSKENVGQMLVACFDIGQTNIYNRNYSAWNNGKTGMEIRYNISLARQTETPTEQPEYPEDTITADQIPF